MVTISLPPLPDSPALDPTTMVFANVSVRTTQAASSPPYGLP